MKNLPEVIRTSVLAVIAICVMLFACMPTFAQEKTLSLTACWNAPTVRENGNPLAAEDIKAYQLIYQQQGDTSWNEVELPPDSTCHTLTDLVPDVYLIAVSAQERNFDLWSDFSDPVTGGDSPPVPPSGLRITVRVDVSVTQ